jgi:nitrogen regulatory protein PII
MQQRLADALLAAGVTGFTMLPVSGGAGRSGAWSREGQVSRASGMTMFICIVREEKLDTVLDTAFPIMERHIGVVSITDCEVLRAERF